MRKKYAIDLPQYLLNCEHNFYYLTRLLGQKLPSCLTRAYLLESDGKNYASVSVVLHSASKYTAQCRLHFERISDTAHAPKNSALSKHTQELQFDNKPSSGSLSAARAIARDRQQLDDDIQTTARALSTDDIAKLAKLSSLHFELNSIDISIKLLVYAFTQL